MRGDAREVLSPGPQLGTSRRTLQKELWEAELGLRESKRKAGNERESRGRISTDCRVTSAQSPQPPSLQAQPESWQREKGHCSLVPLSSPAETLCSVAFCSMAKRPLEERLDCAQTKDTPLPDNGRCHPAPGTPNPKWPTPAE